MKTIKMPLLVAAAFAALTSSTNAQSWLTNGLVAYYPFDGNANNAVNGSQAIVFGSPTPAPDRNGRSNGALHFDGSSYLNIGSFPALGKPLSAFTVSFWFNAQAAANIIGDHHERSSAVVCHRIRVPANEHREVFWIRDTIWRANGRFPSLLPSPSGERTAAARGVFCA